jgi:Mn2+/Fe2+ NRAMP family transporter
VLSSFYLITILFSLLFFSIDELKIIPEPLVYLLKSQEVTFIERLDLFFIFIWMSWSIITVIYLAFTVTLFMEKNTPKKLNSKKIILHLLLFILPLIIIAKDYHNVVQEMLIYGHLLFALIIPFFVIVYNKWRSKNVEKV